MERLGIKEGGGDHLPDGVTSLFPGCFGDMQMECPNDILSLRLVHGITRDTNKQLRLRQMQWVN